MARRSSEEEVTVDTGRYKVVVWGNCQAGPVAELLRAPLARAGLEVVDLPPIYRMSPADVRQVHALMPDVGLLVSQPIKDEYRVPGCSTQRLSALLPAGAQVVTFPLIYHRGAFPFQVTASDGFGHRPLAPLTDYHDLRLLTAVTSGVEHLGQIWGIPNDDAVTRRRGESLAELQRRETECDLHVADLVEPDGSMFTLNHPRNSVLAEVARRILRTAGFADLAAGVDVPDREFLGAIRTPTETGDLVADRWSIQGREVGWIEIAQAHMAWYREHPDVVAHTTRRYTAQLADLGLIVAE